MQTMIESSKKPLMEAIIGGNEAWSEDPNTWSKMLDLKIENLIGLIKKESSSQTTFPSKKEAPSVCKEFDCVSVFVRVRGCFSN